MSGFRLLKRLGALAAGGSATGLFMLYYIPEHFEKKRAKLSLTKEPVSPQILQKFNAPLLTRDEQKKALRENEYDVLIIGGGCTGTGVAVDAVSRGLSVALVEKFDFASGTSSRSTKLIHGGVRYLQKAVFNLDLEQYRMVKEALQERANLLDIAPHLTKALPIMLPVYKLWQVPYFWAGLKMYDLVSGKQILKSSYFLNRTRALELFPMLQKDKLVGAIVYYDGQQEDARMCLSLAITATRYGSNIANYTEVKELLKDENNKVSGAKVRDRISGEEYTIKAKCVINATGPYTDFIRTLDDKDIRKICQPSSGVHIILPGYYSPANMGLLDPATKDGRIIFFLPWQNSTIAGTTDSPCEISDNPRPTEDEIKFILSEVRHYLTPDMDVRRGDVLSAWSGIRPLVMDPSKTDTQSVARNHIIEVSPTNLITIAGGKWTTYRSMAEETVDRAINVCNLKPKSKCQTIGLQLDGSHGWTPNLFIRLIQDFGVDVDVAQHLATNYGDKALKVAKLASLTGKRWPVCGTRLHPDYPYIEAEILYACREYACRAVDILARRTRLAFLNVHAAEEALPRIVDIMARELHWDKKTIKEETEHARQFLVKEMGLDLKAESQNVPINFSKEEINLYVQKFHQIDRDKKGYITINDLRLHFKKLGDKIDDDQLRDILNEVDLNKNGEIDLGEFLQFMSALRSGVVADSRFKQMMRRNPITVDRSGGGF